MAKKRKHSPNQVSLKVIGDKILAVKKALRDKRKKWPDAEIRAQIDVKRDRLGELYDLVKAECCTSDWGCPDARAGGGYKGRGARRGK